MAKRTPKKKTAKKKVVEQVKPTDPYALTQLQSKFIAQNYNDMSVKDIASDTELSEEVVQKHVNDITQKHVTTTGGNIYAGRVDKLMGKRSGATVMSEAASAMGDATRSTRLAKKKDEKSFLHKPRPDDA